MIDRQLEATLIERLSKVAPAVVLLGPRQVGKTTLARKLARQWPLGSVYLDLELPSDLRKMEEAESYLRSQAPKLVVIDEIHRAPELFAVLRGLIDERRAGGQTTGQFLLLGSASLSLMHQSSESLAGRVSYLEMTPIHALEAHAAQIEQEQLWLRGGFPTSTLAASDTISALWRQDFIRSYLERDVPMFAPRMPVATLGRLWRMLAHQQGSLLNLAQLAGSLGVSAPTVSRYVDLLVDLQLVRRLSPWFGNTVKRLTKSPKIYVRDSGIVHALLGLDDMDSLLGHPIVGASYEGFALESLIEAASRHYQPYFYRTHDGAEIDVLLERYGQLKIAIEIKRSSAPTVQRGFQETCDALQITDRFVVYPGQETFPIRHGAQAISLPELASQLQQGRW